MCLSECTCRGEALGQRRNSCVGPVQGLCRVVRCAMHHAHRLPVAAARMWVREVRGARRQVILVRHARYGMPGHG
jgi:hypothetical protein